MHEHGINLIKMKLEVKQTQELKQIWKERDDDKHNSNTIEAVKRILIERGERIDNIPSE